jgi:hypothetical protein
MKRIAILCAALAALWAGAAGAQTVTQDGNSTRTSQQAQLQGGLVRADSAMKALTMSSTGGQAIYDETPLNATHVYYPDAYTDTLSYNGRSVDSTTVYSCSPYRSVVLGVKLEGAWGAAAGRYRIGVTCIMSYSPLASDTTQSFVIEPVTRTRETDATPDSTGFMSDGVTTTNTVGSAIAGSETTVGLAAFSVVSIGYEAVRTVSLAYNNPGYRYVRWKFRVLTEPVALDVGAGKRQTFRLRAAIGMRAL